MLNDSLVALLQSYLKIDNGRLGGWAHLCPAFWYWMVLRDGVGRARRDWRAMTAVQRANGREGGEDLLEVHSEGTERKTSTSAMLAEGSLHYILSLTSARRGNTRTQDASNTK